MKATFSLHDSFSQHFYSTRKKSYCRINTLFIEDGREECFIFQAGICNSFYLQKAALGLTSSSDKPELNLGFPREREREKERERKRERERERERKREREAHYEGSLRSSSRSSSTAAVQPP